jgi:hypothetical protein
MTLADDILGEVKRETGLTETEISRRRITGDVAASAADRASESSIANRKSMLLPWSVAGCLGNQQRSRRE